MSRERALRLKLAWTQTKPCEACPFRRDAPLGFWSPVEFLSLLERDEPTGSMFLCHLSTSKTARAAHLCGGWLADQVHRGIPNLLLRVELMTDETAKELVSRIDGNDPTLYGSIQDMVLANLRAKRFPARNPHARRLLQKLGREAPR